MRSIKIAKILTRYFIFTGCLLGYGCPTYATSDVLLDILWEEATKRVKKLDESLVVRRLDVGHITRKEATMYTKPYYSNPISNQESLPMMRSEDSQSIAAPQEVRPKLLAIHRSGFIDVVNSEPTDFYIEPLETRYHRLPIVSDRYDKTVFTASLGDPKDEKLQVFPFKMSLAREFIYSWTVTMPLSTLFDMTANVGSYNNLDFNLTLDFASADGQHAKTTQPLNVDFSVYVFPKRAGQVSVLFETVEYKIPFINTFRLGGTARVFAYRGEEIVGQESYTKELDWEYTFPIASAFQEKSHLGFFVEDRDASLLCERTVTFEAAGILTYIQDGDTYLDINDKEDEISS